MKRQSIKNAIDLPKCRRVQWREVVASFQRFRTPPVWQTLWFHLAVERKQYQTLAQHVQPVWGPKNQESLVGVWLPAWRCFCPLWVWAAAESTCVRFDVGGLPDWLLTNWWCVHEGFFFFLTFFWTDERQKTWEHASFVLFASHSSLASSLLLDLMLMWRQRRPMVRLWKEKNKSVYRVYL